MTRTEVLARGAAPPKWRSKSFWLTLHSRFQALSKLLSTVLEDAQHRLRKEEGLQHRYGGSFSGGGGCGVASFSGSKTCRGSRLTIRKLLEYPVSAVAAPGTIPGNLRMTKVLRLEKQGTQTRGSFTERCSSDKCLSISESGTRVRHCMRATLSRSGSHSCLADPVTGRCSGT